VQARPETVHTQRNPTVLEEYILKKKSSVLITGRSIGDKIGQGPVRIIKSAKQIDQFKKGEVLVTQVTNPDWEPIMKIAGAIVTDKGGSTSHAAIVSRELGIPCVVGTGRGTQVLKQGQPVTASCAEGEIGKVYQGLLPFKIKKTNLKNFRKPKTKIMMNIGDPQQALIFSSIPNDGVGLAREEFIISNYIKIHPLALINYQKLDKKTKNQVDRLTAGTKSKSQFFVDKLAEGIGRIAAAFYPKEVIVRTSDFKTSEYANLIGGRDFEPKELNPMIGWRGASRYYDPKFKEAFILECQAIKKVKEVFGLKNIKVMIPFCRTVEEGKKVLKVMAQAGLKQGKDGLEVYVMAEIPSNIILAKEFAQVFDGFSIGSNDLTQLTLGVDRDSELVSHIFNERNQSVKDSVAQLIKVAHQNKRKVGICGQAPSDYPEFARFLVECGIDSISLNPDTVLKTTLDIVKTEKRLKRR
ncbi:MAG TPA: phosphoenolpyruvate synthase, partial [Candidatus Portnoybacteria bacterium]|nr:phosphoenolpyruvate synthase [Candidatus Portnoybacteria bacterium]